MDDGEAHVLEMGRLAELGMLSAGMVHELRQPLFASRAALQLLLSRGIDPGHAASVSQVLEQLDHMQAVMERYASSGQRPQPRLMPLELGAAVQPAVEMLAHRARRRGVALRLESAGGATVVRAEAVAVHQITTNLVANALDAASSEVVVVVQQHTLHVRDDGPGIDPELAERLLEPFVTSKPPGEGTGLGLALTDHLVRSLRGELDWQSDGTGTTFRARFLPLEDPG